jgi:prepilin-type N-terminal cleavage/methylation domain-containing protein
MKSLRNTKGFTLIELLVVVAIIGILAAIAIPQFAAYRQRGYDARADSDLRNGATAEEAYYATNFDYIADSCASAGNYTTLVGAGCSGTVATSWTVDNAVEGGETFTGTSTSDAGTGKTFTYDSTAGGMQP